MYIEPESFRYSESMAEVELATASITQPNFEDNDGIPSESNITDDITSVTLEDSAEQILNGVKREVEVQYLVPMADADHEMNQPSQQQIAQQTELQCLFKESGKNIIKKKRNKKILKGRNLLIPVFVVQRILYLRSRLFKFIFSDLLYSQ